MRQALQRSQDEELKDAIGVAGKDVATRGLPRTFGHLLKLSKSLQRNMVFVLQTALHRMQYALFLSQTVQAYTIDCGVSAI